MVQARDVPPGGGLPVDPVCGAPVDPKWAVRSRYEGKDYFFCCGHCQARFVGEPERYVPSVAPADATDEQSPRGNAGGWFRRVFRRRPRLQ